MRTICPKIFGKLDFFWHSVSNGCFIYYTENFWAFLTFLELCQAYPVLKILEIWKEEYNDFRVKGNLAVLP